MIKMNRSGFILNLSQALADKDYSVSDEALDKFLDLNFDEDGSLSEWEYDDFRRFADDAKLEGFWKAVKMHALHCPMSKQEIQEKLEKIYEELDEIQESVIAQDSKELMWEIGEAMGSVDNALDVLEKKD